LSLNSPLWHFQWVTLNSKFIGRGVNVKFPKPQIHPNRMILHDILFFNLRRSTRNGLGRSWLEKHLARSLPAGGPIGESWKSSIAPKPQSVVGGGEMVRPDVAPSHGNARGRGHGLEWPAVATVPILVKWLDCSDRLSLQVHPPASIAARLGGEPKTENWYIAHAKPGAAVARRSQTRR